MKPILILICLICAIRGQAQEEEKARVWKVELTGALNNYSGWEIEPSITYQPIPYAGITLGLLFCDLIENYQPDIRFPTLICSAEGVTSL